MDSAADSDEDSALVGVVDARRIVVSFPHELDHHDNTFLATRSDSVRLANAAFDR
jgi:hypothetical protein